MSNGSGRFMFAGHAIGAAAQFHRLDELENLNHVIPVLGASVLPVTGGRSESHLEQPYRLDVDQPRQRCLFAVERIDTWAEGRDDRNGAFETELSIDVAGLHVVEKLHIDFIRLHLHSARKGAADPNVTTKGNRIEGMRLGNVEARVTIDDEPLAHTGTADRFAAFHRSRGLELGHTGDYHRGAIVRKIELVGEERDRQGMSVDGNTIVWPGFGRIILGEVHVKGHERRVTMVRLAMGSDAGGSSTTADGQSNGDPAGG
jgi:hypothetical protein